MVHRSPGSDFGIEIDSAGYVEGTWILTKH